MSFDETFTVETRVVGCDGGGGPLGHPLVYLHIGDDNEVVCPYCSRKYILSEQARTTAGH